ncbi:MAG: response regulator [Bacteroidetes bacterium]|nr:response regulator [Bacteroidota bacterium]
MYTFLMADDEEIIRNGFTKKIDWAEFGFLFLPPCENGIDTIESVITHRPDVVFTDINMPGKDGLAVCAFIADNYPETTVVILSGYDEFEYAQKAVTFNVFEYILKPINAKKLRHLLVRLKEHLDKERSFNESIDKLKEQAEKSRELIRERLLNRMISSPITQEELLSYGYDIDAELPPNGFVRTILIDPDDPDVVRNRPSISFSVFLLAVQNICLSCAPNKNFLIFQRPGGQLVLILSGKTERFITDSTKEFIMNYQEKSLEIPYSTNTLGISTIKQGIEEIFQAFRESELAVDYRFIQGKNTAIYYEYATKAAGSPLPQINDDFRQIILSIKTAAVTDIGKQITQFFSHLMESGISVYRAELEIQKYFITIVNALEELDISCTDLGINSQTDPILKLNGMKTLKESENWIREFCLIASEKLKQKRQDFSEKTVYAAIDFIHKQYSRQDLSTDVLSNQLAISPGYLSRIFKKHTNMTVLEYLMDLRVEKAKGLANSTDLKNYEIAENVGYTDPGYFSTIFRKITGITLSEYRQSLGEH